MNYASFPHALPRGKTQMSIQGVRKNVWETLGPNWHVDHTAAIILRVPILHVKTRYNHRKHENHRREAGGIPQSVWVACKMRPLLRAPKHATTRCAVAGRVLALPKSASMQHPQVSATAHFRFFWVQVAFVTVWVVLIRLSGKIFILNATIIRTRRSWML